MSADRPRMERYESLGSNVSEGAPEVGPLSLGVVFLTSVSMDMAYSIILPTVWSYTQSLKGSKISLGIVLSAFPVARCFSYIVFGIWIDRRGFREPFLVSFLISIVGHTMYLLAGTFGSLSMLVASRFVVGCAGANGTVAVSYISRVSENNTVRTKRMAVIQGLQIAGLTVGPALNLLFDGINWKLGSFMGKYTIRVDLDNASAYFMCLMHVFCLIYAWVCLVEPDEEVLQEDSSLMNVSQSEEDTNRQILFASSGINSHGNLLDKTVIISSDAFTEVMVRRAGFTMLVIKFFIGFELSVIETAATPFAQSHFNWSTIDNSIAYLILSSIVVAGIVTTIILSKLGISNRKLILVGFFVLLLAFVILLALCTGQTLPITSLLIAVSFLTFALPLLNAGSTVIYSKMIDSFKKGFFFGVLQLSMSAGRILGPLAGGTTMYLTMNEALGELYPSNVSNNSYIWIIALLFGFYSITILVFLATYPTLKRFSQLDRRRPRSHSDI